MSEAKTIESVNGFRLGRGQIQVMGRNSGWLTKEQVDSLPAGDEKEDWAMWPFHSESVGEYQIMDFVYDEDTETLLVVVDD